MRTLPWRDTKDPYKIWLSEIILQQTRVNQGMNYYYRFVNDFPDIVSLANASEDTILKLWQGLGYYSRARNLHFAAKTVLEKHSGTFPLDYKEVRALKGIGNYTAAAICSFAYNQNFAVVDGNVYRVLSRFFEIKTPIDSVQGKKEFEKLADELLPKGHSSIYNQAIMEFGALQCTPVNPDCSICPLVNKCKAFINGNIKSLPVKSKSTKISERFFNYFFFVNNQNTYLQKRIHNDIWKNLFEFPLIETDKLLSHNDLINSNEFLSLTGGIEDCQIDQSYQDYKHLLSHRKIYARFYKIKINKPLRNSDFIEIGVKDIDKYAVSRLTEMYLETLAI